MKSLKDFVLESYDDDLDKKVCDNIKSELDGAGIKTFYVETREDEDKEYPQLYVATCDAKCLDLWNNIENSSKLIDIVENCGVEFIRIQDGLTYRSKSAFEIIFGDTQTN